MKISVVIPTYNRRHSLARTMPTVLAQDFPADDWEVVVVVDGSRDGTAEYLRALKPACKLTVVEQPNRGQGAARNLGVSKATGDLVLLLDDDIVCDCTLVTQHVAAHKGRCDSVVFGLLPVASDSPRTLAAEEMRASAEQYALSMKRQGGPRSPYEVWVSQNASLPRSLFLAVGGYDETLRTGEDDDLAIRLWRVGTPFRFEPAAATWHFFVKSSSEAVQGGRVSGKSELFLIRKHPEHRPGSRLAMVMKPSIGRRLLAALSCRSPVSPELFFRPPRWAAEKLMSIPLIRRMGIFILMRSIEIEVVRSACREAGSWRALRSELGIALPALLYHNVSPGPEQSSGISTVSPQRFERHMRWLSEHGYVGIRPSDWLSWCREGKPLPDRPVLITFDDGYANIAEHALPILRRYNFGAAVYVVTDQIGRANTWQQDAGCGAKRLMSADQIRYWADNGVEFGAHSRSHADLTRLNRERLQEEVEGSAKDLARILRTCPLSFAYPYGAYNDSVRDVVERSFGLALTGEEGLNGLATHAHRLRRIEVTSADGLLDFACRVYFGWHPMHPPAQNRDKRRCC